MKKFFILAVLSSLTIGIQAQIDSYVVESSKTYPDGTSTFYLKLGSKIDLEIMPYIKEEAMSIEGVSNFSFYDKTDNSKLMYTALNEFTPDDLIVVINKTLDGSFEGILRNFGFEISEFNEGVYTVYFTLNDINGKVDEFVISEIQKKLFTGGNFIEVKIDQELRCIMVSKEPISYKWVEAVVRDFGVEMINNYIK